MFPGRNLDQNAPKELHCPREPHPTSEAQGSSCLNNNSKSCLETPKALALGKCH